MCWRTFAINVIWTNWPIRSTLTLKLQKIKIQTECFTFITVTQIILGQTYLNQAFLRRGYTYPNVPNNNVCKYEWSFLCLLKFFAFARLLHSSWGYVLYIYGWHFREANAVFWIVKYCWHFQHELTYTQVPINKIRYNKHSSGKSNQFQP